MIRLAPEDGIVEARSLVFVEWARTEGEVTWGTFVPDPAEPKGYRHRLDLPPEYETEPPPTPKPDDVAVGFIRTYRDRLRAAFSRWDLAPVGVTQAGGAGKPIEATLDDMYLPLRLADTFNIDKTDLGSTIGPDELLQRTRPLVIRGPGGSGKTTWMRWTFRRLLEIERAFPVMIVLRDLARRWQDPDCQGESRSLDAFLDAWVAEHVGGGWEGDVASLLKASEGPRPVLLVDGWDELGELGEELRRKLLGFMKTNPRLQVVVSSRPYGEGRPAGSEGFEVLDIQPLSDVEIGRLADRFFALCYGEDEASARREAQHFQSALS